MRLGRSAVGKPLAVAALSLVLAGCKVMPVEEAKLLRSRNAGSFDPAQYVGMVWPGRVKQALQARAIPVEKLRVALAADVDSLAAQAGRRAGEGSPWTFVVQGEGVVRAVAATPPRGALSVDAGGTALSVQTGPLISGTAIRDAVDFISFDGFPDQIAFAEVGTLLTDRAVTPLRNAAAAVKPGDRVRFVGVVAVAAPGDPLVMTPVELARIP